MQITHLNRAHTDGESCLKLVSPQWEGAYAVLYHIILGQAYTISSPIVNSPTVSYKGYPSDLMLEQEHTTLGGKKGNSTEEKLLTWCYFTVEHRIAKFPDHLSALSPEKCYHGCSEQSKENVGKIPVASDECEHSDRHRYGLPAWLMT